MALLPGALIAAQGFGAAAKIGSDIGAAASMFDKTDKDRLKQLERQVEVGEFLTGEEQQAFFQGIGTQERESFQRGIGDVSAFDLGGGRFVAQQMAQQEALSEKRGKAQDKLRAAESEARQVAEEELLELKGAKQDRRRAMTTALLGGVATAAGTAIDTTDLLQTRKIQQSMQDTALLKAEMARQATAQQASLFGSFDGTFDLNQPLMTGTDIGALGQQLFLPGTAGTNQPF